MLVLLIDDDPTVAEDLRLLLPETVTVSWAAGSREALAQLRAGLLPDAIILDLCLPPHLAEIAEWEGLTLLTLLKVEITPAVPVIVLSSAPPAEAAAACLRRGAAAYLEKPCRIRELSRHLSLLVKPLP